MVYIHRFHSLDCLPQRDLSCGIAVPNSSSAGTLFASGTLPMQMALNFCQHQTLDHLSHHHFGLEANRRAVRTSKCRGARQLRLRARCRRIQLRPWQAWQRAAQRASRHGCRSSGCACGCQSRCADHPGQRRACVRRTDPSRRDDTGLLHGSPHQKSLMLHHNVSGPGDTPSKCTTISHHRQVCLQHTSRALLRRSWLRRTPHKKANT